jgi:hypothetical protein
MNMEKFNNHGLDAINSRVRLALALDDFDDVEQVQHVKSKQVQNRDYTKEYLDLFNKIGEGDLSTISLENFNGISASFPSKAILGDVGNDDEKQNYQQIFDYIYGIIAVGDRNGYGNIEQVAKVILKDKPSTDYWMFSLARLIHVYLKEPKEMPKPPISGEYPTEVLGCYIPSSQENNPYPVIYLCPKNIEKAASDKNIEKKVLYAKVFIHELAHAIMDPTNELEGENLKSKKDIEPKTKSDADVFMEESLANMITLQYFGAAKSIIGEEDFEQVKSFMEKQPEAYKFGITQYEKLHTDWREWRNNKSKMEFWNYWAGIINIEIG